MDAKRIARILVLKWVSLIGDPQMGGFPFGVPKKTHPNKFDLLWLAFKGKPKGTPPFSGTNLSRNPALHRFLKSASVQASEQEFNHRNQLHDCLKQNTTENKELGFVEFPEAGVLERRGTRKTHGN